MIKPTFLHLLVIMCVLYQTECCESSGLVNTMKPIGKSKRQEIGNRQTIKGRSNTVKATTHQGDGITIISASRPSITDESVERLSSILCILLPWLYFLSNSINMPSFPKYVNSIINNGDSSVSPLSQKVYGDFSGLDSFFTFLSVNFIGCLSDTFGRKPFIFLSLAGLGMSYVISSIAQGPSLFYLAGAIDGISSCMLSQAQAYVTDRSYVQQRNQIARAKSNGSVYEKSKKNSSNNNGRSSSSQISEAIGRFQGLAIGSAYVIGIPIGELLSRKGNRYTPLYMSIFLCTLGCILTAFLLPESLPRITIPSKSTITTTTTTSPLVIATAPTLFQSKLKEIKWHQANPFGALNMLFTRSRQLALGTLVYFFVNIAQTGTNVVWMNYLEHRFGWSQVQAGAAYMALGLMVIIIPKLLISNFGKKEALRVALLTHALALFTIGSASSSQIVAYIGIPLLSIGISASPLSLGYLSEQVFEHESGALQGAADTIRSIANMLANPLMSRIMSYYIKQGKQQSGRSLYISAASSFIALIFYSLIQFNSIKQ